MVRTMARLLAPQFIALYGFIAAGFYVHYRGKVRHTFFRQLTDHSTLLAPYNALMYLFSAVPNRYRYLRRLAMTTGVTMPVRGTPATQDQRLPL